MSQFPWSPKQQAAIDAMDTNVLVSASAGAGKTTVLIGRLLKRMQVDRISLDEVIAMTFTELAATEMRKRLAKRLSEEFDQTQDPHLERQLSLLPSAHISTIHAFCLNLIENYGYVIHLDPKQSQTVLDEASASLLRDSAFKEGLKEMMSLDEQALLELSLHFDRKPENSSQLKVAVEALLSKLSTLKDPQGWIEKSLAQHSALSHQALSADLKAYFELFYHWKIQDIQNKLTFALEFTQNNTEYQTMLSSSGKVETNLVAYEETLTHGYKLIDAFKKLDLKAFNYEVIQKEIADVHHSLGFRKVPKASDVKAVKKVWDEAEKAYFKLTDLAFEEKDWFKDHSILLSRMKTLSELALRVKAKYQALKDDAKVIDFNDMEHLAIRILKDPDHKIAYRFKAKIKEIMVDEFQDTNELQNELVELLSNGKNIFRVGDVKQSIYRFRNAQPQLMMKLMKQEDEHHRVLYLDENYRSKQSIVDFNNVLFDQLMNFESLGSQYSQNDSVKTGSPKQIGGDSVEIHFLEKLEAMSEEDVRGDEEERDEGEDDKPKITLESDAYARPKVMHIINTLLAMKHKKDSLYPNYKDYVVLVRSNLEKALLKEQFEKAHIPHHISTKSGFFNANSVQDVLLMLNFVVNPYDDLNLVGLLLSKFVGLDENELASLRLNKEGSYLNTLKKVKPHLYEELMAFRAEYQEKTLSELIWGVYGFKDYYQTQIGLQDCVNLDFLYEKALRYTQDFVSISEFVERIKHLDDSESSEAIPFTEEDDVVRVMTIHQSKGLEFKVVFYFTRLQGSIADNKTVLLMDSDLGFALKTLDLNHYSTRVNPIRLAIEMKNTVDDILEQVRLMYVALTRAESKLIIVDSAPLYEDPLSDVSLLNAMGSTRMLNACMSVLLDKTQTDLKRLENPTQFGKLDPELQIQSQLKIVDKKHTVIEFKTPSSTHPKSKEIRLNFSQEKGTVHGTEIHKLFENLPKTKWTKDLVLSYKEDISTDDLEAMTVYSNSSIYEAMRKGKITHEYAFFALFDTEVLHGYMDCVSICEDVIYLIDYKTDHLESTDLFVELYADQILAYKKVLERQHQKPVKAYLYSLVFKTFIEVI